MPVNIFENTQKLGKASNNFLQAKMHLANSRKKTARVPPQIDLEIIDDIEEPPKDVSAEPSARASKNNGVNRKQNKAYMRSTKSSAIKTSAKRALNPSQSPKVTGSNGGTGSSRSPRQ